MSTTATIGATIPEQRAGMSAALRAQVGAARARNLVGQTTRRAQAQLAGMYSWLQSTRAYTFVSGVLSYIGRALRAGAGVLGKRGLVAIALAYLSSKRGQYELGQIWSVVERFSNWVWDTAFKVVTTPMRWLGFIPGMNWAANQLDRFHDWGHARTVAFKTSVPVLVLKSWLRWDTRLMRGVNAVSMPVAIFYGLRLVPGYWKIPAALIAFGYYAWTMREKVIPGMVNYFNLGTDVDTATGDQWAAATATVGDTKVDATVTTEKVETPVNGTSKKSTATAAANPRWTQEQQDVAFEIAVKTVNTIKAGGKMSKTELKNAVRPLINDDFRTFGPRGRQLEVTVNQFLDRVTDQALNKAGAFADNNDEPVEGVRLDVFGAVVAARS